MIFTAQVFIAMHITAKLTHGVRAAVSVAFLLVAIALSIVERVTKKSIQASAPA